MKIIIDKIKDFWEGNSPIARKCILVVLFLILFLVLLFILSSCTGGSKSYTYESFNKYLIEKAKSTYKNTPGINEKVSVNIGDIINNTKYTVNGSTCTGTVEIYNNNGYLLYIPKTTCANVTYKGLKETLLSNVVTTGNGIYAGNNGTYIFKGDNVKNFVSINNNLYRIIKINNNGTIKLIDNENKSTTSWDNRYNVEKNDHSGDNTFYNNGLNSRVKDTLESMYTSYYYKDTERAYFINSSLCVGKRSVNDDVFKEDIECSVKYDNMYLGLIEVVEYYQASLDPNCNSFSSRSCSNYNYLINIGSTWTITADKDTSYKAYRLSSSGITLTNASSSSSLKVTVNIPDMVNITKGTGTKEDPYVIE